MKAKGTYRELVALSSEKLRRSESRLFLLDFDGTLVDLADTVAEAVPSENMMDLLSSLAGIRGNNITIITGRSRKTIEPLVSLKTIDIIAEHGALIRENGIWKNISGSDNSWKEEILRMLEKYCSLIQGSVIEEKEFSVAWHYRNTKLKVPAATFRSVSIDLARIARSEGLSIIDGKKVIEILSNKINKGIAAGYLTGKNYYDFILSIGDDTTDEDMFRQLGSNDAAFTVKIGSRVTYAKFTVKNLHQAKKLLERLNEVCDNHFLNHSKIYRLEN